jgi:hypothetical protein
MSATPPSRGSRAYDGRLDPDDLDRAIGLDVLSQGEAPDGPDGDHGDAPPSRGPLRAVALIAAAVVGGAILVAVTREEPPPPLPSVTVSAGGDTDVRAERDPDTGAVRALGRLVVVSTSGRDDVEVRTLGVRGPGLTAEYAAVPAVTAGSARTGPVGAEVACEDDAAVDAVLAASAGDYRVVVDRVPTSDAGAGDEYDAPLPGAEEWLAAVRAACVQSAAGRGLRVVDASAAPLAGAAATDLSLTIVNDTAREWADVRLVAGDGRAVVPAGDPADLAPGSSAEVRAVVWSRDCGDPVGDLASGLVAEAAVSPVDGAGFAPQSSFRLDLDPAVLAPLEAALVSQCSGTAPELDIVRTKVREGSRGDSAGLIEVVVDVTVDAATVGVGPLSDSSGQGRITAAQDSWPVVGGTATATLRWQLPSCLSLLTRGAVQLPVRVFDGDLERRYLLDLRGDVLRTELARLCGPTVAAIAR